MSFTQDTRYAMVRWKAYLDGLITSMNPKRTKFDIAAALGVDAARLRQYLNKQHVAGPQLAFEHGEALREEFVWQTSGIEALYAYGHFTHLLSLLKHISVDRANNGPHIAVLAYCTLPGIFVKFERLVLNLTLDQIAERDKDAVEVILKRYRYDIAGLATQQDLREVEESSETLTRELRAKDTRKVISRAWNHVVAKRLLPTFPSTEPALEYVGEDNLLFIDAIINLSKQMSGIIPTLAVLRLWRMLSEWADHVEYRWGRDAIPDAFSTYDIVQRRINDELNREDEAAYQAAYASWRGK